MAKYLPRIQLDPEVHKLVESAAKVAGLSNQDVIEQAMRQLILTQDATGLLRDIAVHSTAQLVELAAKIDGIADFIAERYALDLGDTDPGQER
jgi:hypothetical protein